MIVFEFYIDINNPIYDIQHNLRKSYKVSTLSVAESHLRKDLEKLDLEDLDFEITDVQFSEYWAH